MKQLQRINATQARNDFFNILNRSFLEKQSFLIEKSKVPMVYIIPASVALDGFSEQGHNLLLIDSLDKLRNTMKETSNSTKLLRQMRRHG